MSTENRNFGAGHREGLTSHRTYAGRFAAPRLVDQQLEAANRELRELFDAAEANPRDRKSAGEAIRFAWSILCAVGFPDFDAIKLVYTEEWPRIIPEAQHSLVAVALETIGWYQFGLRAYDIDRTARIFDRSLELSPYNQRALERFALIVTTLRPENINGLAKNPKKQRETALGYKLQCKTKIDRLLPEIFGITEAHLVGQADTTVAHLIARRSDRERRFIFSILGYLSRINCAVGDFFGNGTQLSLGTGAACCQLEILGLPRDISTVVTLLTSRLDEDSGGLFAGEETELVGSILEVLADICDSKWRIFKNHGAQRRAAAIRAFLHEASSRRSDDLRS